MFTAFPPTSFKFYVLKPSFAQLRLHYFFDWQILSFSAFTVNLQSNFTLQEWRPCKPGYRLYKRKNSARSVQPMICSAEPKNCRRRTRHNKRNQTSLYFYFKTFMYDIMFIFIEWRLTYCHSRKLSCGSWTLCGLIFTMHVRAY